MRKIVIRTLSILLIFVAFLCVYSLMRQESFTALKLKFDELKNFVPQGRLANVSFSVPLSYVAGYNRFLLGSDSLKEEDQQKKYAKTYLGVDSTFYSENNVEFAVFEVDFAGLLQPVSMTLNEEKLQRLIQFYKSFSVEISDKRQPFRFSQVHFLRHDYPQRFAGLNVNYAQNETRTSKALAGQFKITHLLLSENGLPYSDAVIVPGLVDRKQADLFGLFAAKNTAIENASRNIYNALLEVERLYPNNKLRVVLKNHSPWSKELYNQSSSHGTLTKTEPLMVLGFDVADLRKIADRLTAYNAQNGFAIRNFDKKVAIAIDSSNLIDFIQFSNDTSAIKDQNLRYASLLEASQQFVEKQLPQVIRTPTNNLLKVLYVSFNNPLEIEKNHYPLSRSIFEKTEDGKKAALLQLEYLYRLYALSQIGFAGENNIVSLAVPRRQLFTPLHYVAKPLAEYWSAYYKRDGADRWEQRYSLDILKKYIYLKQ